MGIQNLAPYGVHSMAELLSSARTLLQTPWVLVSLVLIIALFLGALLWQILRSEEGFLFGYGNWVVGKWQRARERAPGSQPDQATLTPIHIDSAHKRESVAAMERAIEVERNVLTLSKVLDGDIAYLMVNRRDGWEQKFVLTLQTLVTGVTRVVHLAGKCRCRCGFFTLDDDEQGLVLVAGEGYGGSRRPRLDLDRSCAGRAFLTGENYYCRDIANDPVYGHSVRGSVDFRSIACVPVRAGRAVFGAICLDAEQSDAFTHADFVYLETLAAKLAVLCAFHALQVTGEGRLQAEEGD